MAEGVARTSGAHLGVATTGIAGPGGGTKAKPVGLVYHAVAFAGKTVVERRVFPGERTHVKERAANLALDMVRRILKR
jgi:nicotinamide-nucleotide amidase